MTIALDRYMSIINAITIPQEYITGLKVANSKANYRTLTTTTAHTSKTHITIVTLDLVVIYIFPIIYHVQVPV